MNLSGLNASSAVLGAESSAGRALHLLVVLFKNTQILNYLLMQAENVFFFLLHFLQLCVLYASEARSYLSLCVHFTAPREKSN